MFFNLTQVDNESVETFGQKLKRLARKSNIVGESQLVDRFMSGLRPELRRMLATVRPERMNDAVRMARKAETIDEEASSNMAYESIKAVNNSLKMYSNTAPNTGQILNYQQNTFGTQRWQPKFHQAPNYYNDRKNNQQNWDNLQRL